jgi:hypothetical protein
MSNERCQIGNAACVHDWDGFGCAKWARQNGRIHWAVFNDSPGICGLTATAENERRAVRWNSDEKHCDKAEFMWGAKNAFLTLKIVLLHENDI